LAGWASVISIRESVLTVITPLRARRPTVRDSANDKIVKIDGRFDAGYYHRAAVKKLRGAPGSKVTITIAREGEKELKDFISRAS